jgi:adenosine 3'-phospho 5'-phosphosulfate transporter B2
MPLDPQSSERAPLVEGAPSVSYFVVCATLVVTSLGVYGFLQERVMALPYEGEYFTTSVFLVLCNRVVGALVGLMMTAAEPSKERKAVPLWMYAVVSMSNVLSTSFQYEALKFVSFAVQMVGKSTKMAPVMVWGVLMDKKRYSREDWLIAFVVTSGCFCFLIGGDLNSARNMSSPAGELSHLVFIGMLLMGLSIVCDGFTSMYQERLFTEYGMPISHQMLYTNLCSASFALVLLLSTGGYSQSILFSMNHPQFCLDAVVLSVAAVIGQVGIYTTIFSFGALAFAAVLNMRQVLSIVVSSMYFNHNFTSAQVAGMVLTFGGLGARAYRGLRGDLFGRPKNNA